VRVALGGKKSSFRSAREEADLTSRSSTKIRRLGSGLGKEGESYLGCGVRDDAGLQSNEGQKTRSGK